MASTRASSRRSSGDGGGGAASGGGGRTASFPSCDLCVSPVFPCAVCLSRATSCCRLSLSGLILSPIARRPSIATRTRLGPRTIHVAAAVAPRRYGGLITSRVVAASGRSAARSPESARRVRAPRFRREPAAAGHPRSRRGVRKTGSSRTAAECLAAACGSTASAPPLAVRGVARWSLRPLAAPARAKRRTRMVL